MPTKEELKSNFICIMIFRAMKHNKKVMDSEFLEYDALQLEYHHEILDMLEFPENRGHPGEEGNFCRDYLMGIITDAEEKVHCALMVADLLDTLETELERLRAEAPELFRQKKPPVKEKPDLEIIK